MTSTDSPLSPPSPPTLGAVESSTILSSSSSDSEEGTSEVSSEVSSPTSMLIEASKYKEEGNDYYKSGNLTKATRSYRRGITRCKKLHTSREEDSENQVKSLLITLQTNLSMVCLKQNDPKRSRDMASEALLVDCTHVKALYRRAAAHAKLGDLEFAMVDLKCALKYDPLNREVKREIQQIKKTVEELKRRERRGSQKLKEAFSSNGGKGSFLYQDREKEESDKKRKLERKKLDEIEEKLKKKLLWETECKDESGGEPNVTFEEWEKKRKTEQDKAKKEVDKKKEEEDKKKQAEMTRKMNTNSNSSTNTNISSDEEEEFTEKELQALRGYKKTSDGRTTSYFNREVTDSEKALIGDFKPKIITQQDHSTNTTSGSKWNSAQTWEERDTTEWCTNNLTNQLLSCTKQDSHNKYKGVVQTVKTLTGDASCATSCGRKRYIFDFHAQVKFQVFKNLAENDQVNDQEDQNKNSLCSGYITLPEISSTVHEGKYDVDLKWKRAPQDTELEHFCKEILLAAVKESVQKFVKDFNANF